MTMLRWLVVAVVTYAGATLLLGVIRQTVVAPPVVAVTTIVN